MDRQWMVVVMGVDGHGDGGRGVGGHGSGHGGQCGGDHDKQ